jgi:hypothetical protein
MTKPKLDIRQMIRDGQVSTDKAGQLVALEVYENSGLLADSDIRALRETAKDPKRYNAYMDGVNVITRTDNAVAGFMTDARLLVVRIAWALSELRFTVRVLYQTPPVIISTPEAYKHLGEQKRERRLKRTYTLMTLWRIVAENIIANPANKMQELAVANLHKEAEEHRGDKNFFGIDLLDNGTEIWAGWTAYHKAQGFTLADLANDLAEFNALVLSELKGFYEAKQLTTDPASVPLEKWHETPLKGNELANIKGVKLLDDCLSLPESRDNPLDAYNDMDETNQPDGDLAERAYYEMYSQKYAILSRPYLYKSELVDGVLDVSKDIYNQDFDMWTQPRFGYGALPNLSEERGMENDMALTFLQEKRVELITQLRMLFVMTSWRNRAGEILGIDSGDRFANHSRQADPQVIVAEFNNFRDMYYGSLNGEHIINPEYDEYLSLVREAVAPLFDLEAFAALSREQQLDLLNDKAREAFAGRTWLPDITGLGFNTIKRPFDLTEQLLRQHPTVSECLGLVENMKLESIPRVYEAIADRLIKMSEYVVAQKGDNVG